MHRWLSGQKCKILDKPPVKHKTVKKRNPWIFLLFQSYSGGKIILVLLDKKKQNVGKWLLVKLYRLSLSILYSWRSPNVTGDKLVWRNSVSTERKAILHKEIGHCQLLSHITIFCCLFNGENDISIVLKPTVVHLTSLLIS